MKPITKTAWNRVFEKACDVANATEVDDDPMYEVHRVQMLEILDDLEREFGAHSEILDTRADYLDDPIARRELYLSALSLARQSGDQEQVEVVLDSLRRLKEEIAMEEALEGQESQAHTSRGSQQR